MIFVTKEMKEFCQAMLDTYDEWIKSHYEVINNKKGQRIWIANGVTFLTINGSKISLRDKYYLRRKLKKLFAIQITDKGKRYGENSSE